ncbi:hypothetical protein ACFQGT_12905 [Natrialbaceae archaeon GCM10025810]|uniref:hypothetical protein n=1 Tax=Halovalidus salilacus TaxID=3075124 RepID=UPI00360EAB8E
MMWQDLVFLIGSSLSIVFLAPTLRDASARVPLGTSLPSMAIGFVYAMTFMSLGMTYSGLGSFAAGSMWALIALVRSPATPAFVRNTNPELLARDARLWLDDVRSDGVRAEQYMDGARMGNAHAGFAPADD